jgi:hypothetical protein
LDGYHFFLLRFIRLAGWVMLTYIVWSTWAYKEYTSHSLSLPFRVKWTFALKILKDTHFIRSGIVFPTPA